MLAQNCFVGLKYSCMKLLRVNLYLPHAETKNAYLISQSSDRRPIC